MTQRDKIRWKGPITTAREVLATWGYRLHMVNSVDQIPGDTWEPPRTVNKPQDKHDIMLRTFDECRQDGQDIWQLAGLSDTDYSIWHEVGHAGVVGRAGHGMVNWQPRETYYLWKLDDELENLACEWTAALLGVVGAPLDFIQEALGYVSAEDLLVFNEREGGKNGLFDCMGVLPPTPILRAALAWQRQC